MTGEPQYEEPSLRPMDCANWEDSEQLFNSALNTRMSKVYSLPYILESIQRK